MSIFIIFGGCGRGQKSQVSKRVSGSRFKTSFLLDSNLEHIPSGRAEEGRHSQMPYAIAASLRLSSWPHAADLCEPNVAPVARRVTLFGSNCYHLFTENGNVSSNNNTFCSDKFLSERLLFYGESQPPQ